METKNEYKIGEVVWVASSNAVSGWEKAEVHSITEKGCRLSFAYSIVLDCHPVLFFKFESIKKI